MIQMMLIKWLIHLKSWRAKGDCNFSNDERNNPSEEIACWVNKWEWPIIRSKRPKTGAIVGLSLWALRAWNAFETVSRESSVLPKKS